MKTTASEHEVKTGALGESIACKYLREKGYRILERNYRKSWGEIDIVAQKGQCTHFFEVKTVEGSNAIRPEENLHSGKVQRVLRAVQSIPYGSRIGAGEYLANRRFADLD